jgi:hypothetical protein
MAQTSAQTVVRFVLRGSRSDFHDPQLRLAIMYRSASNQDASASVGF